MTESQTQPVSAGAGYNNSAPMNPFTATLLWLWVLPVMLGVILLVIGFSEGPSTSYSSGGEAQLLWGGIFTGGGFTVLLVWLAVHAVRWQPPTS